MTNMIYFRVGKLIRDKIPEILEKTNIQTNTTILDEKQYIVSLKNKLVEEAQEVSQATTVDEVKEEIGDVLEVMKSLMKTYNIDFESVISLVEKKNKTKGGFSKRVFCQDINLSENHDRIKYYRSKPDEYPEIKK